MSEKVVDALLNNEAYFFRDRSPFDILSLHTVPDLAVRRASSKRLRIWSAGCATGQEIYSLAMPFAEESQKWAGWMIDILGTAVSSRCIDRARAGIYSQFEVQRGLAMTQMIKWVEECPTAGARSRRCASRSAFRCRTSSNRRRIPAGSTSSFAATSCLPQPRKKEPGVRASGRRNGRGRLFRARAGETVIGQTAKLGADIDARGLYRIVGGKIPVEKRQGDRCNVAA